MKNVVQEKISRGKILYFECLRVLAAFFVLYNHNYAFNYFKKIEGTGLYGIALFMSCFCKFSVSMFFMISGALLLGKKEEFPVYFKKRVIKTAVIIFAFSFLQEMWDYRVTLEFDLIDFLKRLYKEPATNGYYFLHLYLAFMITLPFFRYIAINMKKQEFYYLIFFQVFFGLLSILKLFFASGFFLNLDILDINVFYPLIGYYIAHNVKCEKINKKNHILLASVALVSVAVSALLVVAQKYVTGEYSETYLSFSIPYVCIWLFVLFKSFDRKLYKYTGILTYLGRGTIGVYLIGNILRESLWPVFEFLSSYMLKGIANFIFLILQLVVGIIVTNLFFKLLYLLQRKIRIYECVRERK